MGDTVVFCSKRLRGTHYDTLCWRRPPPPGPAHLPYPTPPADPFYDHLLFPAVVWTWVSPYPHTCYRLLPAQPATTFHDRPSTFAYTPPPLHVGFSGCLPLFLLLHIAWFTFYFTTFHSAHYTLPRLYLLAGCTESCPPDVARFYARTAGLGRDMPVLPPPCTTPRTDSLPHDRFCLYPYRGAARIYTVRACLTAHGTLRLHATTFLTITATFLCLLFYLIPARLFAPLGDITFTLDSRTDI